MIKTITQGCCNYGSLTATIKTIANTRAWDCLQIPGAKKTNGISVLNNFCGGRFVTADANTISGTICSKLSSSPIKTY
jgi:hypothetical protein